MLIVYFYMGVTRNINIKVGQINLVQIEKWENLQGCIIGNFGNWLIFIRNSRTMHLPHNKYIFIQVIVLTELPKVYP